MRKNRAVIFVTLGAPEYLNRASARKFLLEFLSDEKVLPIPNILLRRFLAWRISCKRAQKYLENLEFTAIDGKAPLFFYEQNLQKKFLEKTGLKIYFAHRYGTGSVRETVTVALKDGAKDFFFVPFFPQKSYAMTSSILSEILHLVRLNKDSLFIPPLKTFIYEDAVGFCASYANLPEYIDAVCASIKEALAKNSFDALLISFHSMPKRQALLTDYEYECEESFSLIKEKLKDVFSEDKIFLTYQSAMGKGEWLAPKVKDVAQNLAKCGVKKLLVSSPGFAFDCTETLVELGEELKEVFLNSGGEYFKLCACLNDSDSQLLLMQAIINSVE